MTSRQKPASFADSNPLLNDLQKRVSSVAHGEESIKRIWLFGSRARGDHNEQSDVDLCVEIDRDGRHTFGIFDQCRLYRALRNALDHDVDLVVYEPNSQSALFKAIRKDRRLLYERP